MSLIGFCGKMGSGKSTAIRLLSEVQSKTVRNVKLAGPLYEIQEYIYDVIKRVHSKPAGFIKDRKLLQLIGTDWGRNTISQTLWLDLWKDEVTYLMENYPGLIIVCDDVRFDNEIDLIKSMGGTIIQVAAKTNEERLAGNTGIAGHASESGISSDKIDHILNNDGTIEDLKNSLLALGSKSPW